MRQGTDRHALAVRGDDLYETPVEATRALLANYPVPRCVWEPACGPGAIVRELRATGRRVYATDLVDYRERRCPDSEHGRDFLMEHEPIGTATAIVTNPPFKLADEFIRHGLHLDLPVIVLLRLAALEGAKRSDLIDRHLRTVLLGIERLPMMHRDGWAGPKNGNSGAPFAWFVFDPAPRRSAEFTMRRISWRTSAQNAAA